MSATPYLTSREAYAVTERLEAEDLMDPNFWVQLLPAPLPGSEGIHFVLRYYATEDAPEPFALVHFVEGSEDASKSTVFLAQMQKVLPWRWGEFKANFELTRKLPTVTNTRLYKLRLLAVDNQATNKLVWH